MRAAYWDLLKPPVSCIRREWQVRPSVPSSVRLAAKVWTEPKADRGATAASLYRHFNLTIGTSLPNSPSRNQSLHDISMH